jgi:predicted NUDIX family NTP pyrophosphohydrolase
VTKRSAGLLLWRRADDGRVDVLIGHPGGPYFSRRDDGVWSVPKGEYELGEDAIAAAYREFAEEVGLAPPDGEPVPLGESRQSSGKINTVFALEADLDLTGAHSNLFSLEWPPRSGRMQEFPELDRVAWVEIGQARGKVWASQRVFVDRLAALVGVAT